MICFLGVVGKSLTFAPNMATPRSVAFHTLGCKLNYSETSSISRLFEEQGYAIQPFESPADIYVINTCSVTDFADQKCRQVVRKALRRNSHARVIVTGCYAQLKPNEIAEIPGVDLVLGAAEKFRMLDYVELLVSGHTGTQVFTSAIKEAKSFTSAFSFGDRTRSFLKVQDGCDYKCTFCTIPLARGASRSDSIANIIENAVRLGEAGAKEIVLTGVNIGDFGNGTAVIEGERPKKEALFIDLIRALDEVEAISRFRISSIEPNLCTNEIIKFVATSQRFMPHFHMPLQSGNDKQLRMMRRRYTRDVYADRVKLIKAIMPHACIGVDVIVGFPGETDADFLETLSFIEALPISYLHVFTYSERPDTPAIHLEHSVPMAVRRQRNEQLRLLSDIKKRAFYTEHLGTVRPALFEQDKSPDTWSGFTDNYIQIAISRELGQLNIIAPVHLNKLDADGICIVAPTT
jgi:threonylcarbamoyladenosine tRNA methylthiotransferase MtaB